ncbi:HPP family-domain-containing protein [Phellopilus nigrolimitatus]|nr:HPP family-domain-containing protein [Phellopilus nigrolimitatus]
MTVVIQKSPNRLARLPTWFSHWLGYRASPPPKRPDYIIWFWSFVGAFGALSILQAIFGHAETFVGRNVPTIIASYGASAVLCFGAIEAPLAQPRALVAGHFISALIGLCITKLFSLSPDFENLRWVAGSLSTSLAIVAMQMTATTHPPAGATALLVAVNDDVWAISWYYLPVVLLSSTMVLVVALLINNIQRRYPVYWISPSAPPPPPPPAVFAPAKMTEAAVEAREDVVEARELAEQRV